MISDVSITIFAAFQIGLDQCQFSDCGVLAPGARCEIGCRWPYEGNSSVASCPDPNIDPSRFPDFEARAGLGLKA